MIEIAKNIKCIFILDIIDIDGDIIQMTVVISSVCICVCKIYLASVIICKDNSFQRKLI